jgi:hypothetical protein
MAVVVETAQEDVMDWTAPLPDFRFVLFDRTDPVQNAHRALSDCQLTQILLKRLATRSP